MESYAAEAAPQFLPILLLLAIAVLFLVGLTSRRTPPYPPGPKGWPLIGNMGMTDQLTHRGLARLANLYGGILHLQIGRRHMVAVSSPDVAKQVLQVQDSIFSNRPATITISYLTYDRADMAFANYGPFWRQMRKLCVMKLFSRRRAESWDSVREEVDSAVRAVAAGAGAPVNVGELVFTVTKSIIYRAAFGANTSEGQDEFMAILQEISKLFGAFNVADFVPSLAWLDLQGLTPRMVKARQSLDRFIDAILDDHIEKKKRAAVAPAGRPSPDEADTDMVDELLAFFTDDEVVRINESEELQTSIRLTRANIKAIIMDVMFGGTETVASAIEWAMAEMMRRPEEMRRVQQEMAEAVGLERRVEERDLERLPYLKCALKETLRLHPPIPLLLHETAEDAVVAGYSVPRGTRVMVNAWAIGRDPGSWSDPDEFRPARFLADGVPDFKGSNFEFVPFGSGRRSCPGMQLGLYALELAVAHLLHCFTWELPDGMKPHELDMDDVFGLTAPRKTRLVAVPTPRLSCPVNR